MERKLQQTKGNGFILKTVPFCAEGKASALRGGARPPRIHINTNINSNIIFYIYFYINVTSLNVATPCGTLSHVIARCLTLLYVSVQHPIIFGRAETPNEAETVVLALSADLWERR